MLFSEFKAGHPVRVRRDDLPQYLQSYADKTGTLRRVLRDADGVLNWGVAFDREDFKAMPEQYLLPVRKL